MHYIPNRAVTSWAVLASALAGKHFASASSAADKRRRGPSPPLPILRQFQRSPYPVGIAERGLSQHTDEVAPPIPSDYVTGQPREPRHIAALDGVRGVAILLVLIAHFRVVSDTLPFDRAMNRLSLLGYTGVDLFFVLSGFLITGILLDARGTPHYFRNFYARRALRILPLYYGVVLALVVVLPLFHQSTESLRTLQHNQAWYWFYAVNFIWRVPGATPYYTGHFWSLAVEEQFYLIWPVIVWRLDRPRLTRLCLVCVAGALVVRIGFVALGRGPDVISFVPTRMDTLAVGALLALAMRSPRGISWWAGYACWAGPAAGVILVATFLTADSWRYAPAIHQTLGYSASALMFAAVVGAATVGWAGTLFGHPVLRFFGKYSYGMYVFHWPLMRVMGPVYAVTARIPLVFGSVVLRQLGLLVIAGALTVGVAMLSWHLYEKWWLTLKRFFASPGTANYGDSLTGVA
jgi:peptidoglycan/LPS O-acetylase OafA/YrhL